MPHLGQGNHGNPEAVSESEIGEELERILASAVFRRSDRLQSFLRYICDLTVKGESERINEYLLATEVFHRPSSFASDADSTVRRQAHLLREKLDRYYRTDGRFDPLRVEVPIGHYVPVFRRQYGLLGVLRLEALLRLVQRPSIQIGAAAVAAAAVMFVAGRLTAPVGRVESPPPALSSGEAAVAEFWGPWLSDPKGAVLCFSNPLTAVIKHYPKPRGGELVNPSLRVSHAEEQIIRRVFALPSDGHIYMTPNRSQIKKGEGFAAVMLAQLFGRGGGRLRMIESDTLTWDDLRGSNTILFGNGDTNVWLDPLLENHPFRLRSHEDSVPRSIVISNPEPSEKAAYSTEYPSFLNKRRLDYALISSLPGLNGDGRLLLVNGLNHFATQAAVEYLTTPDDLESMLAYLRKASGRAGEPWLFQLVLEVEVREGVPVRYHPTALRIIEPRDEQTLVSAQR